MSSERRRVCILVTNPIFADPRVMKQIRALLRSGRYAVHAIGVDNSGDERAIAPIALDGLTHELVPQDGVARGLRWAREVGGRLASTLVPSAAWARRSFFFYPTLRRNMLERAIAAKADLYHANDWTTLPIACDAAEANGAKVVSDNHEMGIYEHGSLKFRVLRAKQIERLERHYLPRADRVISVCQSITDELVRLYRLDRARTGVLWNATEHRDVKRRPLDFERVKILYHGIAIPGRGLESLIDSVPLWAPRFALVLRVVGESSYLDALRDRARSLDVARRIELAPPVPLRELVPAAAEADVGILPILGGYSWNYRICLPNKFFEYTMAGLAILSSDLPEIRRQIERHDLGVIFREGDPGAIAAAVNGLTAELLGRFQANSLAFAREVDAEREFEKLVAIYDELLSNST